MLCVYQCVSVSVCQCVSVSVCQCVSVSVCQCVSVEDDEINIKRVRESSRERPVFKVCCVMEQLEITATKAFGEDGDVQLEVCALLLAGNHECKAQQRSQLHLVFQLLRIRRRRRSDDVDGGENQREERDRHKLGGSLVPSA